MPGNSTSTLIETRYANDSSVDRSSLESLVCEVSGVSPSLYLKRALSRYSENTLSRLIRFFTADGNDEYGNSSQIIAGLLNSGTDEATVSDAMNFLPGNPEKFNQILSIRFYIEFEHLPVDEIAEGSREFERVMALIGLIEPTRVALGIGDRETPLGSPLIGISLRDGNHFFIFRDDRVIQTILDNPDKRDLIRRVIQDHGAVHHETIRDALESGAALGVGSL